MNASEELRKALEYHRSGNPGQALSMYMSILSFFPDNSQAHRLSGLALRDLGNLQRAEIHLSKAAGLSSRDESILFDYAAVLIEAGKHNEAVSVLHKVLAFSGLNFAALMTLGTLLRKADDIAAAAEAVGRAALMNPNSFEANFNAGLGWFLCGGYEHAAAYLQKAISCSPNDTAYRILGLAKYRCGETDEALGALKQAVKANSHSEENWFELGNVLDECHRRHEAVECYRRVLQLCPNHDKAATNLGYLYQQSGAVDQAIELYKAVVSRSPENSIAQSNLLLALNYDKRYSAESIFAQHSAWGARFCNRESGFEAPCSTERKKKLRIGYVSSDFRTHSVAYFIEPILRFHDKTRYELFCYASVNNPDSKTELFQSFCSGWRDIRALSDDDACALIRKDEIDVLVDLSGHMAGNRLGIFARRAAPVQVTYLGYPNTTGLRTIDYRITDSFADTSEMDRFYTERLVRMPRHFLCYRPPETVPEIVRENAHKNPVFGSFNNPAKISSATIDLWSAVLDRCPEGCLLLKYRGFDDPGVVRRFSRLFAQRGIEGKRLRFIGHLESTGEHLDLYNQIDVALDTTPYAGTTTTCEALWMGTPVITLVGNRHASRVGLSILSAIGHAEWAADTPEQYVEKALLVAEEMRCDADKRAHIREAVTDSSLCDAQTFSKQYEDLLVACYRHKTGKE